MTGVEKIKRIDSIIKSAKEPFGLTWQQADEIVELRKGIKVSDWFLFLGDDDSGLERFYKIFGYDVVAGNRINRKLQEAINGGYVRMYDYRNYGRYFYRIQLTAKGKKLIH